MEFSQMVITKLNQLHNGMEAELEFDKNEAINSIKNVPIKLLKENGKCLYPVMTKKSEYNKAEYIILHFDLAVDDMSTNQFQPGRKVRIFTAHDSNLSIDGSVLKSGRDYISIVTKLDEEPDWVYEGKVGIYLLHDAFTYNEAINSIKEIKTTNNKSVFGIIEFIYGDFVDEKPIQLFSNYQNSDLNQEQNCAVNLINDCVDLFFLHGPPGTGKSTTLANAIRQLIEKEKQVLFCAPSNTAIDVMVEKLVELGINTLRIGNPIKISDKTIKASLDYKIIHHEDQKFLKELRKKSDELHKMAGKYKRVFGREEKEHRKLLYDEAKKLAKEYYNNQEQIERNLLSNAQVICCTPALCNSGYLKFMTFNTLVFDEATQATDPLVFIPLLKSKRLVLAGDHLQLGPTVKSTIGKNSGLEQTLFEIGIQKSNHKILLKKQYRMNEKIMTLANKLVYQNKLVADDSVLHHKLVNDIGSEFIFIDTAGAGYNESQNEKSLSFINEDECYFCIKYLEKFIENHQDDYSIGIISPYMAQVQLLKDKLKPENKNIQISTIDGFQGQEKDMIIITCVRSNNKNEIGFLKDYRRMNVAMTRARKKLVIIGDSSTLGYDKFYNEIITYAEEINGYDTVWNHNF